jgi:hypothetical protein
MKRHHLALAARILSGTVLVVSFGLVGPAAGADATASPVTTTDVDTLPTVPSTPPSGWVHIGLPPVLDPEPGVNDPVFSILTRLVTSGIYGTITQERLQQEIARIGGKSRLPYESVVSITREPVEPGRTALVCLEFKTPIDLPVPYSILGYHPGSFTASQHCLFREWELGRISLSETEQKGDQTEIRTIDLEDVHLFASVEGEVKIDIDAWIDALLGGAIDDTDITALMLCRWRGGWYGVAMGYGHDQSGRSGILSLREDKILFPTPDGLRGVGRQMRTKAEYLGKVWDVGEARLGGRPAHSSAGRRQRW